MEWLDLLAVQGTLKSLLWHHSSKAELVKAANSLAPSQLSLSAARVLGPESIEIEAGQEVQVRLYRGPSCGRRGWEHTAGTLAHLLPEVGGQ